MVTDYPRKGMRFLLLLPRTLPGWWVLQFQHLKYCMHCVRQTYLWEHLVENRKERGIIRDLFAYMSLPSLLCTTKTSPCTSPCNRYKSIASFHAVLTACASAKCYLSSRPPGPCSRSLQQWGTLRCILLWDSTSRSSRDQPVEPVLCCTQVGAQELQAERGCSFIEQYRFWQWLERFGFCIRVILMLQFHKMQLHFKWSCSCFSGTSISLQWRRNKANSVVPCVQGSTNVNLLHFKDSFAIWIQNCMV